MPHSKTPAQLTLEYWTPEKWARILIIKTFLSKLETRSHCVHCNCPFFPGTGAKRKEQKRLFFTAVKNNLIIPHHFKCKGQAQCVFIQQVKNRLEMTKHNCSRVLERQRTVLWEIYHGPKQQSPADSFCQLNRTQCKMAVTGLGFWWTHHLETFLTTFSFLHGF